jgi:hypothetical protein
MYQCSAVFSGRVSVQCCLGVSAVRSGSVKCGEVQIDASLLCSVMCVLFAQMLIGASAVMMV